MQLNTTVKWKTELHRKGSARSLRIRLVYYILIFSFSLTLNLNQKLSIVKEAKPICYLTCFSLGLEKCSSGGFHVSTLYFVRCAVLTVKCTVYSITVLCCCTAALYSIQTITYTVLLYCTVYSITVLCCYTAVLL